MNKDRLIINGQVFGQRLLRKEQFLMYIAKEKTYVRPRYSAEPTHTGFVAFVYPEGYELVGIVGTIFACARKNGEVIYHICAISRVNKKYVTKIYRDISRHRILCVLERVNDALIQRIEKENKAKGRREDTESIWH